MKFGAVPSVKGIDLSLPPDHPDTARVLESVMKYAAPSTLALRVSDM